jgi:PAS domain S-box-containing protein
VRQRPDIAGHPSRVLIVDDERHNRQVLDVMLRPEGYLLRSAASGEEALALMALQPPDLILLDIMMPGMDGHQLAARIKADPATRNIPIIMITALDDRKSRMLALGAGAEDFLTKPVDRAELCVRVRNLLRLKNYGDYFDKYSQMLEGEVASRTADLAERTKQAAVLAEQAALLDLAQDAIVVRDIHGRILFWNRGAEVMYGWHSKDALGRLAHELLNTEFTEPIARIDATLLGRGRWEGESIHHTKDGTRLIVASRWTLQRGTDDVPARVLAFDTDITLRKEAESERYLLTERLSLATAAAKVGVWEWDLASNTLTWDATMFEIYGCPPVVPMPYDTWSSVVHPEDLPAVEATLQRALFEKDQGSAEYRITRPDGSIRNISAVERAVLDASGRVTRLIGVDMDITERKQAEQAVELIRQDQLRFKDEFLSHVSHELRSPLTAIKQFTSILLGGLAGDLNKEQREYQEIVLKNIRQLQAMIDDLLEVTRLENGKLTIAQEDVSVSEAVADTVKSFQETARVKGVALSSSLATDLPHALADQTRLRQILIILVDNAIKFTENAGGVSIQARLLQQDPRFLLIEVSDAGCGISSEKIDRIFERLYQGSETHATRQGLGLGLYICKQLVTQQGGRIWVRSSPQRGSTFSFTLPVFSPVPHAAPALTNDMWPAESSALVMVEICFLDAWASRESQQEWSQETRGLLQHCLLPDMDVLLPRMNSGAEGERFCFVAGVVDVRGVSALADRIRQQFERLPHLRRTRLTVSASYSMIRPLSPDAGTSMSSIVTAMASDLEESIKSHIISEAVHHE